MLHYLLALMPDLLLDIPGHIGGKPYLYINSLSLEDTEARPDESDISQVFHVDDILALSGDITALSGGDSGGKMDAVSLAPSSYIRYC